MAPAFLMLGTTRLRAPFLPATSTASPKLISRFDDAEEFARGIYREGIIEAGVGLHGAHDRPSDQMRVRDFALPDKAAVVIDQAAVFVDDFDRDDALRSGERDDDAGGHVLGDASRSAAQRAPVLPGAGLRQGSLRRLNHGRRRCDRAVSDSLLCRSNRCVRKPISRRDPPMSDRADSRAAAHLRATH